MVVVAVSVPVMRANSGVELRIVRALNPPPGAISWLVTLVFWFGSVGVSVLLIVAGLLVPRLAAVRWTAVTAAATWSVCALLRVLLGPAAGRPPVHALAGVDASLGHPLTDPKVRPSTRRGCAMAKMIRVGISDKINPASTTDMLPVPRYLQYDQAQREGELRR